MLRGESSHRCNAIRIKGTDVPYRAVPASRPRLRRGETMGARRSRRSSLALTLAASRGAWPIHRRLSGRRGTSAIHCRAAIDLATKWLGPPPARCLTALPSTVARPWPRLQRESTRCRSARVDSSGLPSRCGSAPDLHTRPQSPVPLNPVFEAALACLHRPPGDPPAARGQQLRQSSGSSAAWCHFRCVRCCCRRRWPIRGRACGASTNCPRAQTGCRR